MIKVKNYFTNGRGKNPNQGTFSFEIPISGDIILNYNDGSYGSFNEFRNSGCMLFLRSRKAAKYYRFLWKLKEFKHGNTLDIST